MIKALYIPDYKEYKYGSSFQRLAKYADAANFGGEKVELLSFDYDPEEPTKSIRELSMQEKLVFAHLLSMRNDPAVKVLKKG